MEKDQIKPYIAARVAKELKDGDVVNLGVGLPTMVPAYLPEGVSLTLQSENGFVGISGEKPSEEDAKYIVNAGGQPVSIQLLHHPWWTRRRYMPWCSAGFPEW